jgi:hypothetical protein
MPFQKGHPVFTTKGQIKKRQHISPKTEFKKGHIQHFSQETREKISKANKGKWSWNKGMKFPQFSGENSSNWKGGKYIDDQGYVYIYQPNHPFARLNHVAEHRFVVEQQIGRYLTPQEEIHHLAERDDNRPNVLMAFVSKSAHQRFEFGKKVKSQEIIFDGRLVKND